MRQDQRERVRETVEIYAWFVSTAKKKAMRWPYTKSYFTKNCFDHFLFGRLQTCTVRSRHKDWRVRARKHGSSIHMAMWLQLTRYAHTMMWSCVSIVSDGVYNQTFYQIRQSPPMSTKYLGLRFVLPSSALSATPPLPGPPISSLSLSLMCNIYISFPIYLF